MDKLEQRVTVSIINDLLSPHIAVINNYQDFADKFIVKLHSHLKTSEINIRNALPITVDLNNIDELDK
ncbi:1049_t:CDS:1, partial [Racocetra fulgida]